MDAGVPIDLRGPNQQTVLHMAASMLMEDMALRMNWQVWGLGPFLPTPPTFIRFNAMSGFQTNTLLWCAMVRVRRNSQIRWQMSSKHDCTSVCVCLSPILDSNERSEGPMCVLFCHLHVLLSMTLICG